MKLAINLCVLGVLCATLFSGCAVPAVESRTAREYEERGFVRSERNPDALVCQLTSNAQARAGFVAGPLVLTTTDAAWESHPWLMLGANAWDKVVLPVGGAAAAIWGGSAVYKSVNGGGNTKQTYTYVNNGGQMMVGSNGGAQQQNPTTTSTSTSSGP